MARSVFDLEHLSPADIAVIGEGLRSDRKDAPNRQAVAERIVRHLYASFRVPATGAPACVLVRCFQTAPYAGLPLEYQDAAEELLDAVPSQPNMRCLALLATRGSKLVWNDVATSIRHQCIPLPSVEVVQRAPMIARLLEELGVPLELVVAPPESAGFLIERAAADFKIFHVEEASGSPFIPAQEDFVKPFGVRSVLGIGGLLPEGELFVVLLFSRVPISREGAEMFRPLALRIQASLLPLAAHKTFEALGH